MDERSPTTARPVLGVAALPGLAMERSFAVRREQPGRTVRREWSGRGSSLLMGAAPIFSAWLVR